MSSYKYPTTEIKVSIEDIFDNLEVVAGKVTNADLYVTYEGYNGVSITNTSPPTITIDAELNDIIQFVVKPAKYGSKPVDFKYFSDIDLIEDSDGVAKNIDQYKVKSFGEQKRITMKIIVEEKGQPVEISWDPTIIVGDPK